MINIETELLNSCIKGDRRAQLELYKKCYSSLMSVCVRYENNKEDAEFQLNNAFYKILTNLEKYSSEVPFEAWIRRIAINTVIDSYRKNKKSKLTYVEEPTDWAPTDVMDYNEADQRFDAEALQNMIKKLPPMSQKVFNMYAIDGYSHKEIAQELNMSEGTSKWHLSSARKKLKELMRKMLSNVAVFL